MSEEPTYLKREDYSKGIQAAIKATSEVLYGGDIEAAWEDVFKAARSNAKLEPKIFKKDSYIHLKIT